MHAVCLALLVAGQSSPELPAGPIELDAKRDGDGIQVTFKNPLPTPLDAVRISIQYEGCYGKPGSKRRSATEAWV